MPSIAAPSRPQRRAGARRIASRPARLSTGSFAADLLTLPHLAPEIPQIVQMGGVRPTAKTVAEGLLLAGVLDGDHWYGDLAEAVTRSCEEWFGKLCRNITGIGPGNFNLTVADRAADEADEYIDPGDRDKSCGGFMVNKSEGFLNVFTVRPGIDRLEKARAGLGRAVYGILENALGQTLGMYGPEQALWSVRIGQWMGEDDETARIEESEWDMEGNIREYEIAPLIKQGGIFDPKATPKDIAIGPLPRGLVEAEYGLFTMADFIKQFPDRWTWEQRRPLRLPDALPKSLLRQNEAVRMAGELAEAMAAARREFPGRGELNQFQEFQCTSFLNAPLVVTCGPGPLQADPVVEHFDNHQNDVANAGAEDNVSLYYASLFDAQNPASIARAVRRMERAFEIYKQAEALLGAIGKKIQ